MVTDTADGSSNMQSVRRIVGAVIFGLWIVCLFLPAFGAGDGEHNFWAGWTAPPYELQVWWSGAQVLGSGALGLVMVFTNLTVLGWLSNVGLLNSCWRLAHGRPPILWVVLLSTALSLLSFFAMDRIRFTSEHWVWARYLSIFPSIDIWRGHLPDDAHAYPIRAFGAGFWLWLTLTPITIVMAWLSPSARRSAFI